MDFDWLGDLFGGGGGDSETTVQNDIQQLPDYAEATQGRGMWLDALTKWGADPNYGAIGPDWDSLWEGARQKVQRFFAGGPEGPGVDAKVNADLARRGVSEQPAAGVMKQRSGFQQGNMLMDLAVKQAMDQAALGEKGRQTWLGSVQNLSGLKPSFSNFGTTTTKTTKEPGFLEGSGTALGEMFGFSAGSEEGDWMKTIMDMFGGGGDTGIGDVSDPGNYDEKEDYDMWEDPNTYAEMAKIAMMFI